MNYWYLENVVENTFIKNLNVTVELWFVNANQKNSYAFMSAMNFEIVYFIISMIKLEMLIPLGLKWVFKLWIFIFKFTYHFR